MKLYELVNALDDLGEATGGDEDVVVYQAPFDIRVVTGAELVEGKVRIYIGGMA